MQTTSTCYAGFKSNENTVQNRLHLDSCQVRHRTSTYDVVRTWHTRHPTSDVRCRIQHRTYDIVRTMLHTTLNIRRRTFVNIVGATYDIVGQTYDIVCSMKCMSYAMSYVPENLRHCSFVNSCRIRCLRS